MITYNDRIGIMLEHNLVNKIDTLTSKYNKDRSKIVRELLRIGLKFFNEFTDEEKEIFFKEPIKSKDYKFSNYQKEYNKQVVSNELAIKYFLQLTVEEQPEINEEGILTCICTKCKTRFEPIISNVRNRIMSLNGNYSGESRLYCSDECKNNCDIFGVRWNSLTDEQRTYQEELRHFTPQLKNMVIERDGNFCQMCETTDRLELHHIEPISSKPHLASDADNMILLCYECHRNIVHQLDGCKTSELSSCINKNLLENDYQ